MARAFLVFLAVCTLSPALFAQAPSVRTQDASNFYYRMTRAGTDTLSLPADTAGDYGKVRYLARIVFSTIVTSDTIIVRRGTDTVVNVIFGTAPAHPIDLDVGAALPTSTFISIIKKKTSDVTFIFRRTY